MFVPDTEFNASQMFVGKAKSLPRSDPSLLANIILGSKDLKVIYECVQGRVFAPVSLFYSCPMIVGRARSLPNCGSGRTQKH